MITFFFLLLCFVLPNMVWQFWNRARLTGKRNSFRHMVWTWIFWIYCAVAVYVAGIGTIWDILYYKEVIGGINLIPFSSGGILTYLLNLIMLMPLGFLLPFIWKEYRPFGKVLAAGFGFSFLIEIFQLFNRRLSDVDDLIMNTLGACVGYLLWKVFSRLVPNNARYTGRRKKMTRFGLKEPRVYIVLGILGVFLLYNWRPLDAALAARNSETGYAVAESDLPTVGQESRPAVMDMSHDPKAATVICNDGSVEELTYDALLQKYHENPADFEAKYAGAVIRLVDTAVANGQSSIDDTGKMYRSLTFKQGWRVEFGYEGYDFIDEADASGRRLELAVESFIAGVWEYESGQFRIVLGSWDENLVGQTIITEAN